MVVCQSFRSDDVPAWLDVCLGSVCAWADACAFDRQLTGDDILDLLPSSYRARAAGRWPVLTDLGRLYLLRRHLADGAKRALWLDADVLVFAPDAFQLPDDVDYAFGREIWVQGQGHAPKVRKNVHNAAILMTPENPVLEFYIHACEKIMDRMDPRTGQFPNQIVGPKLLTSWHNAIGFPLMENVGMLSPLVVRDVVDGGGAALDALRRNLAEPLCAANLCASMVGAETDGVVIEDAVMLEACQRLLAEPMLLSP